MTTTLDWQVKTFKQLSTKELHDVIKLRLEVFVVEQNCVYQDLDNNDTHENTVHVFAYDEGEVAAYLRILPKGLTYQEYVSIGRVVTSEKARGKALGHQLIAKGIEVYQQQFDQQALKISAQEHLQKFYQQHGFVSVGESYLEDGIPHIGMVYQKNANKSHDK
ncbi:GNAT family N-acetyltransferase [Thalassotalea sp. PLHSN55]|uniref:GNAT family N-acetyltransferase n=1 Tax=Thalassotalea sp. PLHSN55 TaxID=3435888 RepID=UPI003F82444F